MQHSVAFFNNKGGVGKTTLACNMASLIAEDHEVAVLIIDCDPQCNATQLLLTDQQWDSVYSDTRSSSKRTILQALRHIRVGDSTVDTEVPTLKSNRFNCDVLPGHPGLATVEDRLSNAWVGFLGGDPAGARRSLWLQTLVQALEYDLIIFDVGPSLGALNRTVLLGSMRFVTPMAADLFSLYALDNISTWINAWTKAYARGVANMADDSSIDDDSYSIPSTPTVLHAFAGYTVQQYVTKSMGGQARKVNAYDRYKREIPKRAAALDSIKASTVSDLDLGVVPNMFSMVPLAQAVHAPITSLTLQDGLKGGQVNQQTRYADRLREISKRLITNIGI
jgi:cellulose biosynthesis protein BcsQ